MTSVFIRNRREDTHRLERPCEDRDKMEFGCHSQGDYLEPSEAERGKRGFILSFGLQREHEPEDTLTLGFWLPELQRNKFLFFFFFKPPNLW